ncbi:hypothetical protein ADL26_06295 [Thermoactinomyces vulgaris]|jgi:hypothetical protein|nr:hypothetical protein ADL26_06295 [Thermoactinomyces vulgaris]
MVGHLEDSNANAKTTHCHSGVPNDDPGVDVERLCALLLETKLLTQKEIDELVRIQQRMRGLT